MSQTAHVGRVVGVMAALTVLLTSCADDTADTAGSAADSDEPIVIGGTLGLTGTYSTPSAAYRAAYDYWAEQVNASGGILGRQVEMQIYDDESDPTTAQQLYQRLIDDEDVDLLLAPFTTAVGGAVVPITERAGMVLWNPGFVSQRLHSTSDLIVTSWLYQEPQYSLPLFEFLKSLPEDQQPKTIAIATAQNPFPIVVRDGFEGEDGVLNYAEEMGLEVVFNGEYNQQATDLTSLVQAVKATDADLFVGLGNPNDSALMATTVRQVDYRPEFYCQCGAQVVSLPNWEDLGEAGQNVFSTTTAWPGQANHPGLEGLFEHFKAELGYDIMPTYGAGALAILQVLQQAVEGAQSLDQRELREYVGENTFETAVGPLTYNEDGTADFGAQLVQQQAGGAQIVWPEELATADAVIPYHP